MELNPGIEPRNLQNGQVITIMPGYQYFAPYDNMNGVDNWQDDILEDDNYGDDLDSDVMCDLISYFRMLWSQHVYWSGAAILAIIHELPEKEIIIQRLLRNPVDFANALQVYYGEEEAQSFANLFTAHIQITAELVEAAKAGNDEAATAAEQRWMENVDQIAQFLISINPNWSLEDWNAMLDEHLMLFRDLAMEVLVGDYEESVNTFDEIEAQALEMADMMAEGIAMQFQG